MNTLFNSALIGLTLLAGVASAQTWTQVNAEGVSTHTASVINSGTTLTSVPVQDPRNKVWVFLKGSGSESATIIYQDSAGNTIDSQAVAVGTTYTSVTLVQPQYAAFLRVSPTTFSGTDNISASVVQTRAVF